MSRAKPREKPRDQQADPERQVGNKSWVDRSLAVAARIYLHPQVVGIQAQEPADGPASLAPFLPGALTTENCRV